jgi:hypothetical protein
MFFHLLLLGLIWPAGRAVFNSFAGKSGSDQVNQSNSSSRKDFFLYGLWPW